MNHSTVLACLPDKGFVKTCPSGCVHVTYCGVTLDFARSGFDGFVKVLNERSLSPHSGQVEVECFHATLHFWPEEFLEFTSLVNEGRQHLILWENQQRHARKCRESSRPPLQPLQVDEGTLSPN